MKIGLIANLTKPDITKKLIDFIKSQIKLNDVSLSINLKTFNYLEKELKKEKLINKVNSFDETKSSIKFDFIISFGGDGTMLYSGAYAIKTDVPLFGVNFGKLGFLADCVFDELNDFLTNYREGKYFIEKRILLEAFIGENKQKKFFAINDIVIDKGGYSRIIQIETFINNKYLTTFSADGLIISTPTGSTGYSLSTGGPILVPESNMFVISPICPHTLTFRPIVIPSDSVIKINALSDYKNISINSDGHKVFKPKPPLNLTIKKSDKVLKLIRKQDSDFFRTLRDKLMWGLDLRIINQNP